MRKLLAVLLGIAVAGFAVMGVETLGQMLFPPPAGLDASDPRAIEAYIASAPLGALMSVLVAWAVGALAGSFVAARISDGPLPQRAGMLVGAILFVMAILTMFTIPHPVWFIALSPVACLLPAIVGAMIGSRRGGGAAASLTPSARRTRPRAGRSCRSGSPGRRCRGSRPR